MDISDTEYSTWDEDGRYLRVSSFENCIKSLQKRYSDNMNTIARLREENRKIKEEYDKDEEIQKMKQELQKMRADYYRGFPISEEEELAIQGWQKEHEREVHGLTTMDMRIKASGVSGGRYTYTFLPTSIGTSGVIQCSCGAKFQFQELG
jgi:predicted RNase H-like nuclease (RuvC/YqgF family)